MYHRLYLLWSPEIGKSTRGMCESEDTVVSGGSRKRRVPWSDARRPGRVYLILEFFHFMVSNTEAKLGQPHATNRAYNWSEPVRTGGGGLEDRKE